ncbi:MAG: autotransporter outer membrane beta-barrel domain-containing protein [Gammaproteobacteria bacterium]|nr:autotransporter outer membrane beta-barrel domain-containing protein [Gammaproteobacteria bacterium]MCF6362879.1 autotransporter outer membrane beta-barrel domain-containing protein [Gammaproteobacteria bacterium]
MAGAEEVLSSGQGDLLATCRRLEVDDPGVVAANLDLLAHEEVSAQGRVVIETAKLQSASIHRRLTALRAGARGVSLSGLTINIDGQTLPESVVSALFGSGARGGSAGEEAQGIASRWGAFINANVIIGDRDKTDRGTGFDFRARGVTAGADYRISDALVVGSALGYASKDSDFKGDAGNLEMDSWHLAAYGSYYQSERFYLDGLLRLGRNNIDTDRRINLPGDPQQEGVGSTTGWEYAFSLSGGYEYSRNALTAGPYGRLGFIQTSIDGYTESASNPGGAGAGSILVIDDQDVDSITAVLGGQVTYAISARNAVYLLQINGEWEHEFTDNSRAIAAQFVYDPTRTSFDIRSDNPDRNYFNLGLGVTAVFANGRSGFLHYESRLGQDNVRQYWINGGIRIEL